MAKTKVSYVATAFVENWVIPYGIRNYLLSENVPQFFSKFFAADMYFARFKTTYDNGILPPNKW